MIEVFPFAGQPVAVFGLARSGISAAKALAAGGAEVWAWDDSEDQRSRAAAAGVALVDLYACDWSALSSLVLSPGVPLTHPRPHAVVTLAKAAGCEIIGDIELLARTMINARYIGVTGTNGKSTTTALIGHILSVSGQEAEVGGNLIRIQGISFSVEDPTELRAQALKKAVQAMVAKAKYMAEAADVELGSLVYMTESGGAAPRFDTFAPRLAFAEDISSTPISVGELDISVTVQGVFSINQ